jgi:hypothetical protein
MSAEAAGLLRYARNDGVPMRKLALFALLATAMPTVAASQPVAQPPRLLVVISVDQLSSHLFEQYRQSFTAGLMRMQLGTGFINGYQSHAATETCPGHSTILTGARPATNGIIANSWVDQKAARADKTIYCAEMCWRRSPPPRLMPTAPRSGRSTISPAGSRPPWSCRWPG